MIKILYRIRKYMGKKEILASFSERKIAEKISKRLNYKTFIEEVTLDDEGKILQSQ